MSTKEIKLLSSSFISRDNWDVKKGKLKEKFPYLTEEDLAFEEGKAHIMLDNLHIKLGNILGVSKEGLHKFIHKI